MAGDELQDPVELPGATAERVRVAPGDFVSGDGDGLVVVPAAHVDAVLARAEELSAMEAEIRAALQRGLSLAECLEQYGRV